MVDCDMMKSPRENLIKIVRIKGTKRKWHILD